MNGNLESFLGQSVRHSFAVEVADFPVADNCRTTFQQGSSANSTGLVQKIFADMDGIGSRAKLDCDNANQRIHRLPNLVLGGT